MPKIVDHNERRRTIARAAAEVIAEAGIEGFRLKDVGTKAQCTTGAIAYYYDSKDELLTGAIQYVAHLLGVDTLDPDISLEEFVFNLLPLDEEGVFACKVWLAWAGRIVHIVHSGQLGTTARSLFSANLNHIESILRENQRQGRVRDDLDLETEAKALAAYIDGLAINAIFSPEVWNPEQLKAQTRLYLGRLG